VSLRIDYLSPLPPVRSGISDYSIDLLPELRRLADVRVLRLPGQEVAPEIVERFDVRDESVEAGADGRVPLYQMGNNRYHLGVWEIARERPGVVVLHDLVLHHFLLDRTVGRGRWEPYHEEMVASHGWVGDVVSRPVRWGVFGRAAQFELPANRTLLGRQRGVVVHGRWAAERLAEEDPRLEVRVVPMGIPLPEEASHESGLEFRRRHEIPAEAPLLGSFGFQTPIKRTDIAIRALALPELAATHLLVAGELSPYAEFGRLAEEIGVASRVHLTGFLGFDELGSAIAASDLCLNLRYPSAGETSASLLRILAVGRPAVVSDYAEFGELPESFALRVPLGEDEVEGLAAALAERLAAGPEALRAMGALARRHVAERHAPAEAAQRLVEVVAELAGNEPPGDAPPVVPPRTSVATTHPAGQIEIEGLEGWAPGTRRRLDVRLRNLGPGSWSPSADDPGGILFEVGLEEEGGVGPSVAPPWLHLQAPVEPGQEIVLPVELRRPLGPTRLVVQPMRIADAAYRSFGTWRFERWL